MSHTMRTNPVKRNLQGGGRSLGTMVMEFDTSGFPVNSTIFGFTFFFFHMPPT